MLNIHQNIKNRIDNFIKNKKIPNIIFHGKVGSGKNIIIQYLITGIYKNTLKDIKEYVIYINCSHNKGIRFFRDELKFFAKTNIQTNSGELFKSIILFNADKLTIDTQSALRRCIEKFSHTTRFFIVIENKEKLLKPILSRFCNLYIPLPIINKKRQTIYKYKLQSLNKTELFQKRKKWLSNNIFKKQNYSSLTNCLNFVEILYEKGYSSMDFFSHIQNNKNISKRKRFYYLFFFDEIRKEFRYEKLIMFYILFFVFMRPNYELENIEIM